MTPATLVTPVTSVTSVTSHHEEPGDLEELEIFARTFKQRRIKLGFTQVTHSHTHTDTHTHTHTHTHTQVCFAPQKTRIHPVILYTTLSWRADNSNTQSHLK